RAQRRRGGRGPLLRLRARRLDAPDLRPPLDALPTADERRVDLEGDFPRRGLRDDPAPGELPAAPRIRAPDERRPRHAAGIRRPRAAPLLALPDGERPRARRRGQLVVPLRARGDGRARDRADRLATALQTIFEGGHDLLLDLGLVLEEAAEGLAGEDEEAQRGGRGHRGRAARVLVDQRDLAEEIS